MGKLAKFFGFSSTRGKTQAEAKQAQQELREAKKALRYTAKWVKAKGQTIVINAQIDALPQLLGVAESEAKGINDGIQKALPSYRQSAYKKGSQINRIRSLITDGKN